jgi:HEPN domain-containing protein
MNRDELQQLARLRLKDGRALLRGGNYDGAYYLLGYVVECGLKACIARQTQRYDFPDRRSVSDSYTHDLEKLAGVAGLQQSLNQAIRNDSVFAIHWGIAKDWSEESRYNRYTSQEARALYSAITGRHGVLRWIRQHW